MYKCLICRQKNRAVHVYFIVEIVISIQTLYRIVIYLTMDLAIMVSYISHDHCLVLILFPDVLFIIATLAVSTSNFFWGRRGRPYIVFRNYVNVWLPVRSLVYIYISVKKWRTCG